MLLENLIRMLPDVAVMVLSEYDYQVVAKDVVHVEVRSFLREPIDLVELKAALSSARSKAKLRQVGDFQGKLKTEHAGITGSISKQGTLRGLCFKFHAGFKRRLMVRVEVLVEADSAAAVRAVADVLVFC